MTTINIQSKFTCPTSVELKKTVRNIECVSKLKRNIENDETILGWLEDRHKRSSDRKCELLQMILENQKEIAKYEALSTKLNKKLANAKEWMLNSSHDVSKDEKCINFQLKAEQTIKQIHEEIIPLLKQSVKKRNLEGAIEYHEKYIRNKPQQVMQRLSNDAVDVVKKIESYIIDFYSVKCKTTHLAALKKRLESLSTANTTNTTNTTATTNTANQIKTLPPDSVNELIDRISKLESALAFRKTVDSRANGMIQTKLIQEYLENEQNEIIMICSDEYRKYINRLYFKSGIEAFYI